MLLIQKLKDLENQVVYMRWLAGESYGKLEYVGSDFVKFKIINTDHEYVETIYIRPTLILEVVVGGNEIAKIVAELSHKLTLT